MMPPKVTYAYQPLVRQHSATFAIDGTEWQVIKVEDWEGTRFAWRANGGMWSPLARFHFADTWREDNGMPAWTRATFRAMVEAFLAAGEDD